MQSIKVSGVKIVEVSFGQKLKNINAPENAALKNSIGYIHYLNPDLDATKFLPARPKFRVDFTISNTFSGFANGIRKCVIDEIPIYSLTMLDDAISTNDSYVVSDVLQKNIDLIPILQDGHSFEDMSQWAISLDVLNTTSEMLSVVSGDIKISHRGNPIPAESIMSPNIPIMDLYPMMHLKIASAKIVEGSALDDAAKFATVSNTRYLIDAKAAPLAHSEDEKDGESSLVSSPTTFTLGYTTYRNVNDPRFIIYRCCDSLNTRLSAFRQEMNAINVGDVLTYFSHLLDIETRGEYQFFNFKNESWTLVNMISQCCYYLDPDVPFVAPSIIHPSTSTGVIKIKHAAPLKLMRDALDKLIADIGILRGAF